MMFDSTKSLKDQLRSQLELMASKGELVVWDSDDDRGLDIEEYVELIFPFISELHIQIEKLEKSLQHIQRTVKDKSEKEWYRLDTIEEETDAILGEYE